MKNLFLLLVVACCSLQATAQTNLDSLYAVWQDQTQTDSLRTAAYKDYVRKGFLFSKPDTAFVLAEELVVFGQEKPYPRAQALGYNLQGVSYALKANYPKALAYFQRSLKISEEIGDKNGIASALGNIGLIYNSQSKTPKALAYYQRSLIIMEEIGDKKGIANALGNIGIIYEVQSNYPKALAYYQRGLKINEEIGDKRGIANALNNIGNIYNSQSKTPKALEYYQRSLKIKEEIGDTQGIAYSLANIGLIYRSQSNYPKALAYYQRGLKIYEEIGDKKGIAHSLANIGLIYKSQSKYQNALKQCQKSLEISEEIGSLDRQESACSCLYETYKAMGKGNDALVYLEKIRVIEDSLQAEETTKKLEQMEFAKQALQDSIANAEEARLVEEAHQEEVRQKNKTRNMLAGGGILGLILAGGIYSRLRYTRKAKAIIEKEKDRSENLLLNILPADIAAELKEKGRADARDFDMVSILFTDFKGFTAASEKLSAQDLVAEINTCFEAFDGIMGKYNIEKIKTIGDAYMAAGGLPIPADDSVKNTVLAALEMQAFVGQRKAEMDAKGLPAFEMRVGIHTGPVVAGIVGVKKFVYDIWGDTVNTASRMESSGEVGQVNISEATYELVKNNSEFDFTSRGKVEAKGKGEMEMLFVTAKK